MISHNINTLTSEENNVDYLKTVVLEFNVLAAIADFDTGQIVMGQSICDGSLSTYQKLTVLQYNLTALWTPKVSLCLCGMKVRISGPIPKRAAL